MLRGAGRYYPAQAVSPSPWVQPQHPAPSHHGTTNNNNNNNINIIIIVKIYLLLICLTSHSVLGLAQSTQDLPTNPAKPCQFPYVALLRMVGLRYVQCAGSLIDSQHVITAAHCLSYRPSIITAHFGTTTTTTSTSTTTMTTVIPVEKYTKHPRYVRRKKYLLNDVAILRLTRPVNITACVRPIALADPTTSHTYQGRCVTAGWGGRSYHGPLSRRLHYTSLPIVPLTQCLRLSPYLRGQHLCAGELVPHGRTTCQGDSGSPLTCTDAVTKSPVLVGIVSYGWKCDSGLSVFARVSYFNQWISQHIL